MVVIISPCSEASRFLKERPSKGELKSTYKPGVTPARLDKVLPEFIVRALQGALTEYNKKMHGYIAHEAIVAGVESDLIPDSDDPN